MDSEKPIDLELAIKLLQSPRHQLSRSMQVRAVNEIARLRDEVEKLRGKS